MSLPTIEHIQKLVQSGQFQLSADLCLQRLSVNENEDQTLYLLAVCYRYEKQFAKAKQYLVRLIELCPDYGRAFQELAHIYFIEQVNEKAVQNYRQAVKYNPALISSWQRLSQLSTNIEEKRIANNNIEYLHSLPKALLSVYSFIYEGKLEKAEKLCRHFLTLEPKHTEAMRFLAKIAEKHQVLDDAEFLLQTALKLTPQNYWVKFDYINVLHRRQKFELAYSLAQELHQALPNDHTSLLTLANQQAAIGKYNEAILNYQQLITIDENSPTAALMLGHAYKTIGHHALAIENYLLAIQREPRLCDAYWSLANLKTYRFSDELLAQMQSLKSDSQIPQNEQVQLHFALAKALEDKQDFEQSFVHYQQGNNLKREQINYRSEVMTNNFALQKSFFSSEVAKQLAKLGYQTLEPIFILGLPRTGSTLVEQILSSHSLIDGTLELPNILAYVQELNGRQYKEHKARYPNILSSIPAEHFAQLGRRYIDETRVYRGSGEFFIDKMPNNFRHIGLIKSILPQAKIIDTRREIHSCCFAIYKQLFAEGQEFSYSFDDIVSYYRDYVELMEHWSSLYPEDIYTVNYETLVNEPTQTIDALFKFLNIDVEQNCYQFFNTERAVRTASAEQVRQPINRKGMEQWKNFEPYLDELKTLVNTSSETI